MKSKKYCKQRRLAASDTLVTPVVTPTVIQHTASSLTLLLSIKHKVNEINCLSGLHMTNRNIDGEVSLGIL